MLDGMSDSIQRSRIEDLHSREVDRQSATGLIFMRLVFTSTAVDVDSLERLIEMTCRVDIKTSVHYYKKLCIIGLYINRISRQKLFEQYKQFMYRGTYMLTVG